MLFQHFYRQSRLTRHVAVAGAILVSRGIATHAQAVPDLVDNQRGTITGLWAQTLWRLETTIPAKPGDIAAVAMKAHWQKVWFAEA